MPRSVKYLIENCFRYRKFVLFYFQFHLLVSVFFFQNLVFLLFIYSRVEFFVCLMFSFSIFFSFTFIWGEGCCYFYFYFFLALSVFHLLLLVVVMFFRGLKWIMFSYKIRFFHYEYHLLRPEPSDNLYFIIEEFLLYKNS